MQKLIRRVRPAMVTTTPAPSKPAAAAPRVLRFTSDRLQRKQHDEQAIREDLKLIAECDAAIDRAQDQKEQALARVEARMREHKMGIIDNGTLVAEMVELFTRQETSIDPKKFRSKVDADTFWKCVNVSVGKAKEHLAAKEFHAIADITPGKANGHTLKYKELGKRK